MEKLVIKNLHVSVEDKEILKGLNLTVNKGDMVALLGPNGHGKSTLLEALMGNPRYKVTEGSIELDGVDLLSKEVDERSKLGLFLAMQYPSEIPGVVSSDFYKASINARQEKPVSLFQFYKQLDNAYKVMGIPFEMANRNLNEGFSGGEKKRNEILQMLLLQPQIAMLDEIDSGLDVDAIQVVSDAIVNMKNENRSFLVVSHYQRLFNLIKPTRTAIIVDGRIVLEGGPELVEKIDTKGYEWLKTELGISLEKSDSKKPVSLGVCVTKEALKK